jgi:hypothetical protein
MAPRCHATILSLNMTATVDAEQFIPRRQVAPRGAHHFQSDLCKSRCDLLLEVIFILWSLSVHKWLDVPHKKRTGGFKSGEFASHGMGPSRPHQWFLYVSSKNSRTVRAQCGRTLHGHPSRSYSNKLLRDMYNNFLYTTVYFSNISNGSPRKIQCEYCLIVKRLLCWRKSYLAIYLRT